MIIIPIDINRLVHQRHPHWVLVATIWVILQHLRSTLRAILIFLKLRMLHIPVHLEVKQLFIGV